MSKKLNWFQFENIKNFDAFFTKLIKALSRFRLPHFNLENGSITTKILESRNWLVPPIWLNTFFGWFYLSPRTNENGEPNKGKNWDGIGFGVEKRGLEEGRITTQPNKVEKYESKIFQRLSTNWTNSSKYKRMCLFKKRAFLLYSSGDIFRFAVLPPYFDDSNEIANK